MTIWTLLIILVALSALALGILFVVDDCEAFSFFLGAIIGAVLSFVVFGFIALIITSRVEPKYVEVSRESYKIYSYEFQQKTTSRTSSSEYFNWIDDDGKHAVSSVHVEFVDSDDYTVDIIECNIENGFWYGKKTGTKYEVHIPYEKLYKNQGAE